MARIERHPGGRTLLASDLGFADIDNDGKIDMLARRSDGALIYFSAGSGNPIVLTISPVSASQLRFGDFDGDHLTDIFRRDDSADWSMWFANTRTWTVAQEFRVPLSDLRFGDFDGDGRTDVIAVEGGAWSISRGASSPWAHYAPKFLGNLSVTVAGDFDGDGKADLAWQDGDVWVSRLEAVLRPPSEKGVFIGRPYCRSKSETSTMMAPTIFLTTNRTGPLESAHLRSSFRRDEMGVDVSGFFAL